MRAASSASNGSARHGERPMRNGPGNIQSAAPRSRCVTTSAEDGPHSDVVLGGGLDLGVEIDVGL